MLFSYNWLQSYFKKLLPKPEKLAEILTMHSFEVAEVKKVGKDYILDIDVLPNRGPDCLSHLGVARESAAITNSKLQVPSPKLKEDKKLKAKDFVTVEVKNKSDCSRYTARVVTDVKVGPSPKWIQERLKVCRLRPINNIVDVVNYVMLETGQPLHAFDFEKISGIQNKKIIVRKAKKGEKITTLDNEKYNLSKDVLIIADLKEPLAIAGIKGGKKAEIDKKTKIVVLESANFNQRVIRQGSKKLGLKTDASWRFEHGIDPNLTEEAISRAAYLIQEIAHPQGGYPKVASGLVDFYPKKIRAKKIKLDLDYVEKLLGIKISKREIENIFKRLTFKTVEVKPQQSQPQQFQKIMVEVPTWRLDISLPEDLVEEIGRIYGYEKIPATFPIASLIPPKKNFEIFWEDMTKNILKEAGFSEVYNYSFIGEKEVKIFKYGTNEIIEVENPVSLEQKYLRPSLILNLLKNAKDNFKYSDEVKIFELGKIFSKKQGTRNKKQIIERRQLSGVITGDAFFQLKGTIDLLLNKLGISNIWYDSYQPTPEESKITIWQPKKCAEIKVNSEEIGFLGEISPKILEALKIQTSRSAPCNRSAIKKDLPGGRQSKIVLFDIDFEKLIKLCSEEHEYQPISQYPAAVRDIAVLVPAAVRVEEVLNKINIAGGPLIRDIDLFDIYEGEEIPAGKKNLAFHIIYQAEDKTLTTEGIDRIQNKIIKSLEKDPEWEVRR